MPFWAYDQVHWNSFFAIIQPIVQLQKLKYPGDRGSD